MSVEPIPVPKPRSKRKPRKKIGKRRKAIRTFKRKHRDIAEETETILNILLLVSILTAVVAGAKVSVPQVSPGP